MAEEARVLKTYIVHATRFEDHWYVEVPQLALWFDCADYASLLSMARRAISEALRVAPSEFFVDVQLQQAWDGAAQASAALPGAAPG